MFWVDRMGDFGRGATARELTSQDMKDSDKLSMPFPLNMFDIRPEDVKIIFWIIVIVIIIWGIG